MYKITVDESFFANHNSEVRLVWDSYNKGDPVRIPMILGLSSRYFMFNDAVNPKKLNYREYTENPDLMFEMQVRFDHFRRMNIQADYEMGIPEDGWSVIVDFQNYFDAAWLGAEIIYLDNNVPDTLPFLNDNNKNMLFDRGIPNAFSGLMERGRNYYEYFKEKSAKYSFKGAKVAHINPAFTHTDGPFTIAGRIRGSMDICLDLYEDPEYVHKLMDYITEAEIYRIKEWRKYLGYPETDDDVFFADDSIMMLSNEQYIEFVLPYHKKLCRALSNNKKGNTIHLCGDAVRHFKTIRDELNVTTFDTGFPVKHKELVKELGADITILGGPHIELLRSGTIQEIECETKRIIDEVKSRTKKFILREANNLAPYTTIKNITAMYTACKKYGVYQNKAGEN